MSTLKEKAQRHAAASWGDATAGDAETIQASVSDHMPEPLPDIDYTGQPIASAEQVPVHVAFARVMADVQAIGKGDRRNDSGGKYMFRGIDRVVNAVGPALRRHGVLVVPVSVYDVEYRDLKTKAGGNMQEATLKVKWRVIGPMGDHLPDLLETAGQATDTQDKATTKAISVAQRTVFLAGLHIPTDDPTIDEGHDRGDRPTPKAADYVDEICNPNTSLRRLLTIKGEIERHNLGPHEVTNPEGDREPLGRLLWRIGKEREEEHNKLAQVGGDS